MTKYLVTGGAGYIGSNLVKKLSSNGRNEIISIDNYSTGSEKNHVEGVQYIHLDTCNIANLDNFIPDIVYHLGEYSRVEQSYEDIELVWESNIFGTYEVLKFCRETSAKLIYAGSSTKFSKQIEGGSHSPYGWTKTTNTDLVKHFGDWFNLQFAIIYFYNVFGRNEIEDGKYATVIAKYKKAMRNNATLNVVLPGEQQRNFTHIDDIIKGLQLVEKYGAGDGYAIGNENSYSIIDIAKTFGGKIKYLERRAGNRMGASIDCSKLKKLGWNATIDVKDYIKALETKNWTDDAL